MRKREQSARAIASPDCVIIAPDEDILIENAGDLESAVSSAVSAGKRNLIVDLEKVEYLSSLGIGALCRSLKKVREAGGEIKLINVKSPLRRLLTVSGLTHVLDICESEDEALADFGGDVGRIERNLLWAIRPDGKRKSVP